MIKPDIHERGVKIVLVSMGARGILLVTEGKEYLAVPPEVKVKNTICVGDSTVEGFVYGLVKGRDLKESLIFATAAGTATTLKEGTALAQKNDFERLVPEVRLKVLFSEA